MQPKAKGSEVGRCVGGERGSTGHDNKQDSQWTAAAVETASVAAGRPGHLGPGCELCGDIICGSCIGNAKKAINCNIPYPGEDTRYPGEDAMYPGEDSLYPGYYSVSGFLQVFIRIRVFFYKIVFWSARLSSS